MTDTELTLLAKKAAKEYLTTNRPLNEIIAEYKSIHALTDDQTRRVIERANAAVYLEKYHSLGDDIRNVTFEVADPYVILQTSKLASRQPLRLTERPTDNFHMTKRLLAIDRKKLDEYMSKAASTESVQEKRKPSLAEARLVVSETKQALGVAEAEYFDARRAFLKEAQRVLSNGVPVEHVVQALKPYSTSTEHLAELLPAIEIVKKAHLLVRGDFTNQRIVNERHPLIQSFIRLGEAREKLAHLDWETKRAEIAYGMFREKRAKYGKWALLGALGVGGYFGLKALGKIINAAIGSPNPPNPNVPYGVLPRMG